MLSITDVPGVASTFKKLADVDPSKAEEIKKYQKSLKEQVERALRNNQSYLHENIKVHGKSLKEYSNKELKKLMMESNNNRLISLLDEELTYRLTRKNCLAKLNEDENKSLKEQVERALRNNQKYLHENIKVNGKSLKEYSIKEIKKLMMEANSTKIQLTNKLKDSTLNESVESKKVLKDKIANKIRLISLLDEELTYRVTRKNCLAKLNEDEDKEDKGSNGDFSEEDLSKMFGGDQADNAEETDTEEKKDDNNEEEEVVDLARVVITMEDKDAAEELKKSCLDAGIPEKAIEIEEESDEEETEEDAEEENSDESEEETSDESEEKEQPNESVKYKNLKRLFEDEETEENDSEDNAEDTEDNTEETEDTEESEEEEKEGAVKFILTDTDYIKDLAKILDDEYGISKEEFEEMIGGEIVDEDEESDEEATEEDTDKEDKSEDSDEDAPEDDIDPAELFKGL